MSRHDARALAPAEGLEVYVRRALAQRSIALALAPPSTVARETQRGSMPVAAGVVPELD